MRTLLSTTALAVALGLPSLAMAQATPPASNPTTQTQTTDVPGFLSMRSHTDILASDLMGHDVYARRTPEGAAGQQGQPQQAQTQQPQPQQGQRDMAGQQGHRGQEMATLNRADLENMDNIGQINEIVLSNEGQVRAIVIGVGGFLGMGEQDVAVTMDQVTFASDPEDRSRMYVVVNTGADALRNSPPYDRTANDGRMARDDARTTTTGSTRATDRTPFMRPEIAREGYAQVEVSQVSSKLLVGKSVYGVNDENVGTVDDLVLNDAGQVAAVVIDFGGFLGIGSSQAALKFEELTILSNAGDDDVLVYVDAT
ncbi:MAG: PRC-barrel domain containing protein, partial [Salinarimonadaceae bacterium]